MKRIEYYTQACKLPSKGKNWVKIFKYAKLMEEGVEFPPVKIFYNNVKRRWDYNDGRNRVMAAKMANVPLKVRSTHILGNGVT